MILFFTGVLVFITFLVTLLIVIHNEISDCEPIFLLIFLVCIGVLLIAIGTWWFGYKDGQVDALTNKVKYELVVNKSDSTRTWQLKKESE